MEMDKYQRRNSSKSVKKAMSWRIEENIKATMQPEKIVREETVES